MWVDSLCVSCVDGGLVSLVSLVSLVKGGDVDEFVEWFRGVWGVVEFVSVKSNGGSGDCGGLKVKEDLSGFEFEVVRLSKGVMIGDCDSIGVWVWGVRSKSDCGLWVGGLW